MRRIRAAFERRRRDDEIVVVSGLPRSGTSLMMKMLEAGGLPAFTDGARRADADNPRGYYELEQAKKLSSGDAGWLDDARGRAVKVIAMLLYHLPDTHRYRVVFMRRNLAEVLASQRQMLVNRGQDPDEIPDEDMARIFDGHLERLGTWLAGRPDISVLEVDYNDMMAGRVEDHVELINDFVGGGLDTEAMARVVEPDLYRQREISR